MKNTGTEGGSGSPTPLGIKLFDDLSSVVDKMKPKKDYYHLIIESMLRGIDDIETIPYQKILDAFKKAMLPDDTLSNFGDISMYIVGDLLKVSFSHNYLQRLAYASGKVKKISSYYIMENDVCEITNEGMRIQIDLNSKDRGRFSYIITEIIFKDDTIRRTVVSSAHINRVKKMAIEGTGSAWKNFFVEMARKVGFKNSVKGVYFSEEMNIAISIDNEGYAVINNAEEIKDDVEYQAKNKLLGIMKEGSQKNGLVETYFEYNNIEFKVVGENIEINAGQDVSLDLEALGMTFMKRKKIFRGKISEIEHKIMEEKR